MLDRLRPDRMIRSFADTDRRVLEEMGIDALIFDLDNTLTRYNSLQVPDAIAARVREWTDVGHAAVILTNNSPKRTAPVAQALGIRYIADAHKPSPEAFLRAAELLGRGIERTASVGDQLMTDVRGAKRVGMKAILVNPIGRKEYFFTYFHRLEEFFAFRLMGIRRPK